MLSIAEVLSGILVALLVTVFLFPSHIGVKAAEFHTSYIKVMTEKSAEAYKEKWGE